MAGWLADDATGSVAQPALEVALAPNQVVGQKVTHRTAHSWLRKWRDVHGHGKGGEITKWEEDWTGQADWREYISHRDDADIIIGTGIVKFTINFLSLYYQNMMQRGTQMATGGCRTHPAHHKARHVCR